VERHDIWQIPEKLRPARGQAGEGAVARDEAEADAGCCDVPRGEASDSGRAYERPGPGCQRRELLVILSAYISDGEKAVLFSTHVTSDVEKIADFITLIHNGAVFYTGTKDDLLESYRIVKGGPEHLTDRLRQSMVGLERNSVGFSGLVAASELKNPPVGIVAEAPSIDDILVRISAGA
jgi:hypothetical protein